MGWRAKGLMAGAVALLLSGSAFGGQEGPAPQYGGSLEIGTVYYTISALSFDNYDFAWKHNHDTGAVYEQLFATDLSQAQHNGGKFAFVADAWIPTEAMRGELAEKWEWNKDPLQLIVTLRKGVMFPEKPGVMKSRELVADDIVYTFNRLNSSPKKIAAYFDFVSSIQAKDKYTVVFNMKEYNAEWAYRFGYGYYSGIIPHEVVEAAPDNAGAKDWKNANGTGPFMLTDYVAGNSHTYTKNPNYWDKEKIGGTEYKLPFVDKVTYRIIKDEATVVTAFRTGKLDMLEAVRWQNVEFAEEDQPADPVASLSRDGRPVSRHAGRYQAVRRHSCPPCAQHGCEQEGDRRQLLQRQCRAVRLSAASGICRLLRAARKHAGQCEGALHLQS